MSNRRSCSVVLSIMVMLGVASCGGNNDQPQALPDSKPQSLPNTKPPQAPSNVPQLRTQGDAGGADVNPAPPKGAVYTIFCQRVEGDMHVQRANRIKHELIDATKMKDWYVIHDNDQSLLYYGYYRVINDPKDPKETQRAQLDRIKIDLMTDPMGNRPFQHAVFVELDAPDPQAPPEWNLVNAKGAYSLQIAVYKDSPDRKQAAVDTVRAARAQGVDAYYYHGATSSLVCVGAWPESSVQISQQKTEDSSRPIMVAPANVDRDAELSQQFTEVGQQANIKVVKPTIKIVDPTLKGMMEQYPYNALNGAYMKHMVDGKEQFDPSLLVPIPHDQAGLAAAQTPEHTQPSAFGGSPLGEGPVTPPANIAPQLSGSPAYDPNYRPTLPRATPPRQQQEQQQQAGQGKLKSIGD